LENTNAALAGHEAGVKLPETREFYWSKIQREIARQEAPVAVPEPVVSWMDWAKRRWLPVSGIAAACAVVLLMVLSGNSPAQLAEAELRSDDMGAYTYSDQQEKMTIVWFYDRGNDSQFTPAPAVANVHRE
jgi:hypothetical protein